MSKLQDPIQSQLTFGAIQIDRESFKVLREGQVREITPRAFDVLLYLIDNRERVAEKQEIFEAVWKDTFVTDNALMRAIREIRRELGDSATVPKYIETVHKRGYRFIGTVELTNPNSETQGKSEHVEPRETAIDEPANYYKIAFLVLLASVILGVAWMFTGSGERRIRSIAVMPLASASSESNTEHISDEITESVINSLSELPEIKVVARATAFRYRGQEFDPQRISRELGVDAILTGRLIQQGDDLTLQVDLIDASDGSQIWGSRYNRKLATVYQLHVAITIDLVKKLDVRLTSEQSDRIAKNYTENPEAYRLYSLGRFFWNKRSENALNKSIEYFQQAIEKDPNYALAYAGLADSYAVMAISADLPAHEVFPKARAAATRALALDDGLVEPHATMLRIKAQYEWDWDGAEEEYRRALELNPNYPMTHIYYLSYLVSVGRPDEAVESVQKALDLDPLSLIANAVVSRAMFFAGRYDDAIEQSRRTLELDENIFLARLILGRSYARKGEFDMAITELERARQLPGTNSEATSLLAYTLAVSGRSSEARRLLDEMKQLSSKRYVQPFDIAIVHAGLGEKEEAIEWLEMAYRDRNHQVPLLNSVPELESLRGDPKFTDLASRIRTVY